MSTSNKGLFVRFSITILLCSSINSNIALDTINVTQTIKDGDTISSAGGSFELGFFSVGNSENRYVGIYYKTINVTTPVWVANRETPLTDSSGNLMIREPGILVLLNSSSQVIWSSNVSNSVQNPVAQLLDTGNLVIKNAGEENPNNFIWQSFDYPGNTLLSGMKLEVNFLTGQDLYLTSWKSDDDPSPGEYTYRIDTHGYPQITIWKGVDKFFRVGPWIGDRYSGQPLLKRGIVFQYNFEFNNKEVSQTTTVLNNSTLARRVLSDTGVMEWFTWAEKQNKWITYSSGPPTDSCDSYALCGAYGNCNVDNNPQCACLDRFIAKYPADYNTGVWLGGCVRRTSLDCEKGDKFLKYSGLKLPDTSKAWFNMSMTLEECSVMCLRNCSCMAYSNMNFTGKGSGCFIWFEDVTDLRSLTDGQDIYLRMAFSESGGASAVASDGKNRDKIIVIVAITISMLALCIGVALFVWKKKHQKSVTTVEMRDLSTHSFSNETRKHNLELPVFELDKIINATDNFSFNNKLGEGGYGTVYKARLDGQEVAVKRLSKDSRQGFDEFMNEATFIAKLQHRNLVKLLGCCIEAEENILIYEYMPNKSLETFIFDKARSSTLDWPTRFNIINGISRGLVYLHQDSRLRIIHRDLKASNILLDIDMNPKIADFGMARNFGENQTAANTTRVVGTYGYMSPEYQLDGLFSIKSDVFSFGVLTLEIISGRRNRGFHHPEHHLNLLGHAWTLFKEVQSLELVDAHLIESGHIYEILRCIHVALLCVQQSPEDRPTMSNVVLMLGGEGALSQPQQPGFFTERNPLEPGGEYTSSKDAPTTSTNEITITLLGPR